MKGPLLGVLISLLWGGIHLTVSAQELLPEDFVRADIEARQATLAGLEVQLALLEQGADDETQARGAAVARRNVAAAFARYGTTASAHAAYGTRHRAAIDAWLSDHPDWQQTYRGLEARFNALASQFDALVRGN